jgi:hypothetical protein
MAPKTASAEESRTSSTVLALIKLRQHGQVWSDVAPVYCVNRRGGLNLYARGDRDHKGDSEFGHCAAPFGTATGAFFIGTHHELSLA